MKLNVDDFYMDWPVSINLKNLRSYITVNLEKKGEVIRWSIVDIRNSIDCYGGKKIRIKVVLAN